MPTGETESTQWGDVKLHQQYFETSSQTASHTTMMRSDRWMERFRLIAGLAIGGAIAMFPTSVWAQVVEDPSLGTTVIPLGANYAIINGTTVGGRNLFHSFARFDLPNGTIAAFFNNPAIANIFARVTGGSRSTIDGPILTQGTANLFLLNPNGILFGPGAQLNVGGSFVATTANAIQFPGGAAFSPTSTVDPANPLLVVNPAAFLFSQTRAPSIINRSTAGLQTVGG
ncbi:MAG: filamentous hemagglutinin N-terminal domain-containing protein, partial [Kovacikia sp.]